MNKRAEDGIDNEDIEETAIKKRSLFFNPAGIVIKPVVVIAVVSTWSGFSDGSLLYSVFNSLAAFAGIYAMASLFGFILRLSITLWR